MSEHPHLLLDNVCIVLVNTQFPGNIGAVARAMKNMGLSRLYLVNPSCKLDKEAWIRATSATEILEKIIIADTLSEVISDCQLVRGHQYPGSGYEPADFNRQRMRRKNCS